jgi:hypothetical protein
VQSTSAVGGTAPIDTGFISFQQAPVSGDQYRIVMDGSYLGNPGGMKYTLPQVTSPAVTPVP